MADTRLIDTYDIEYEGVTITVQKRVSGTVIIDYGYTTSSGRSGIGQKNPRQAEIKAMHAIDRQLADEAHHQ